MSETTKRYDRFLNPTRELEFAIQTLESYQSSPFTIKRNTIDKAIADINRHRYRLSKLMHGDSDQKGLAARALRVIQDFNERACKPKNWMDRFFFFFRKREQNFPQIPNLEDETSHKISTFLQRKAFSVEISPLETDLFRMKAISLLRSQGYHSFGDVMHLVRQSPIDAVIPESSIISLSQTLSPFPGETVILKGSFSRTAARPVPLPDTFEISSCSRQTGFPQHPILHTGFAVPDCLIPSDLHRLDELPETAPLLKQKQEAAKQLMPRGDLIDRAKQMLKEKREFFRSNARQLLELHRQFCDALCSHPTLTNYFDKLQKQHDPIEALAELYHQVNELSASAPYERLIHAWKEHTHHDLFSTDPERRYQAAYTILEREYKKGISNQPEAVRMLAQALAPAYRNILLQHLSELIQFHPPRLGLFEQKLQEIAFHQSKWFIRSILQPVNIEEILKKELEILRTDQKDFPIALELERYFQPASAS